MIPSNTYLIPRTKAILITIGWHQYLLLITNIKRAQGYRYKLIMHVIAQIVPTQDPPDMNMQNAKMQQSIAC
jgi:hypothetical protein